MPLKASVPSVESAFGASSTSAATACAPVPRAQRMSGAVEVRRAHMAEAAAAVAPPTATTRSNVGQCREICEMSIAVLYLPSAAVIRQCLGTTLFHQCEEGTVPLSETLLF